VVLPASAARRIACWTCDEHGRQLERNGDITIGYRRSAYPGHGRSARSTKLAPVKTNIEAADASPPALACPRAMRHGCYAVQATKSYPDVAEIRSFGGPSCR
jgi:hypothetical protein